MFSTALDYYTGLKINSSETPSLRRMWLLISVVTNLGFLGVFKYYNFFAESFITLLGQFGFEAHATTINIILPVGISFYTFHGLSYVFDIYNKKIQPRTNIVNYSLFVSFFPLLVAGPIERATHLLPQLERPRNFDYPKAVDGLRQILWGLFKKMVIADNCAEIANQIFDRYQVYNGSALAVGAVFFALQIYGDFSGYSDIALGTARLFGIELLRNFAFPYFSRDIAEFWRRWHISLSSWFRDYLYFPLGGSREGKWQTVRNTFIIFLVSGFWHGANWTFIAWGAFHALCFMPLLLMNKNRHNIEIVAKGKILPTLREFMGMVITFGLVVIGWVFFRAQTIGDAFIYIRGMLSKTLFQIPAMNIPWYLVLVVVFFIFVEWLGREEDFALRKIGLIWPRFFRWSFYYLIVFMVFYCTGSSKQFIYFQFLEMRKMIVILSLFLMPVLVICVYNAVVLSPIRFTHRVWDGLLITNNKYVAFYPNYYVEMDEIGDLGFRTSKAIKKHVVWEIDGFGFRNDSVISNPDILIIGDSFVAGGGLSQEHTITNVLSKLMPSTKIYSMAPTTFSTFLIYNKTGRIKKPKLIILFCVERFLNEKNDTIADIENIKYLSDKLNFSKFDEILDRMLKGTDRLAVSSFFHRRTGIGIPSVIDKKILFFEGKMSINNESEKLSKSIENAKMINDKCKSMGIRFLFIPMPNKESLYWESVPFTKQPDLLYKVDSILNKNKILTINALDILTKAKSKHKLLYHLDDTHWNNLGVQVVADRVKNYIDSLRLLK